VIIISVVSYQWQVLLLLVISGNSGKISCNNQWQNLIKFGVCAI